MGPDNDSGDDPVSAYLELICSRVSHPTARNIAGVVASLLREGQIAEGGRLPGVRELAIGLSVSPATVSQAWTLLRSRGLLRGRGKAGVTVSTILSAAPITDTAGTPGLQDLRFMVPDPELLPTRLPVALAESMRIQTLNQYDRVPILAELLEAVEAEWPFKAGGFIATNGGTDGIDLALRTLTIPGDRVAIENPTSTPILRILNNLNLIPVPIRDDGFGPTAAGLQQALKTQPSVFLMQPRARVPTGSVMPHQRIEELAGILKHTGVNIVELDDANQLSTASARSIGFTYPNRTLLVRSFSKSHGPDLRVAVVGGPDEHIQAMSSRVRGSRQWTSKILQGAVAWMLGDAQTREEVFSARDEYALRLTRLRKAINDRAEGVKSNDGLCLWLPVADEAAAQRYLESQGILTFPGSDTYVNESEPHLRVATSKIRPDTDQLADKLAVAATGC